MEDKGGAQVYEAYEVKKKGKNYAVFYFAGNFFFYVYIYEVFTLEKKVKTVQTTKFTAVSMTSLCICVCTRAHTQ